MSFTILFFIIIKNYINKKNIIFYNLFLIGIIFQRIGKN